MTRQFSKLIAWCCTAILIATPIITIYFLVNIDQFFEISRNNMQLPIQWQTVDSSQWYGLWLLFVLYLAIGLTGLYFLRRAFLNFSNGQLYTSSNSRDLRFFSILLFIQALAKPLFFMISSVLLSLNHPAGQKILSLNVGSDEAKVIALAMILWIMSDLLVRGSKLENENKQFI